MNDRFETLLDDLLDGELTPEHVAELDALLAADPDLLREAADRLAEHRALGALLQPVDAERFVSDTLTRIRSEEDASLSRITMAIHDAAETDVGSPVQREQPKRQFAYVFAFAASVVLASSVTFFAMRTINPLTGQSATTDATASQDESAVATLILSVDCDWATNPPPQECQPLNDGLLHLRRGTAVIRFASGAEMVMSGENKVEIESSGRARLIVGSVVVRADEGTEGFTIRTPARDMIDLGTEFRVNVDRHGGTELHVLDGAVGYGTETTYDPQHVLHAGKALRFAMNDSGGEAIELNAERFADLVSKSKPRERRDLMTVYEGFFYDEGVYALSQMTAGKGWNGPWRLREGVERRHPDSLDATTDMRIVHSKLDVAWPVRGGRLGMLEMPAGQFYRVREMAIPLAMDQQGITYFSLMSQEPHHAARTPKTRPAEGMRLTFRSRNDYWSESLSFGLDSKLHPVVQSTPAGRFVSVAAIPDEQTLLWIGKIVRRSNGEDEISFRIYGQNDSLDYAEPASWHVVSRGVRLSAPLDLVVLTSTGTSPRIVDEIRIGPTWRSVVPIKQGQETSAQ